MAGIMNKTARQYNLKCIAKSRHRVVVRVAPGFNVVDDEHWNHLKNDPYVKSLKKSGDIDYGKAMDDMELEIAPDTKAKSKSTPPPQPAKQDDNLSEVEKAEAKAKTAEANAKTAEAEAKTAEANQKKEGLLTKVFGKSKDDSKPEDDDL